MMMCHPIISYKYTQKELKELLQSLTILVDTREQKNEHITEYLVDKDIPYENKKLDFGDYSFMLPENSQAGIVRDIYFNNQIIIERKRSLDELSNNFTHERIQFENELIRADNSKFILLVEDVEGYENIIKHNYRTEYNARAFTATLHSFRHRYNVEVMFIRRKFAGNYIYFTFYYWLRECLKN